MDAGDEQRVGPRDPGALAVVQPARADGIPRRARVRTRDAPALDVLGTVPVHLGRVQEELVLDLEPAAVEAHASPGGLVDREQGQLWTRGQVGSQRVVRR
jgi:hypothetical protein